LAHQHTTSERAIYAPGCGWDARGSHQTLIGEPPAPGTARPWDWVVGLATGWKSGEPQL